ncbi:hypothetical protein Micbo1qcDRAFT_165027 [Microdochium bolleyi]|uniref:Uncharacterized protein n=1 Tax=Microdochium bolleyi TaxID=196109 RepID=A0A136IXN7_9PEZI|nr:hypothetical protein Micbo1qcDRAFT_165027 [Microdochium bolleyi]
MSASRPLPPSTPQLPEPALPVFPSAHTCTSRHLHNPRPAQLRPRHHFPIAQRKRPKLASPNPTWPLRVLVRIQGLLSTSSPSTCKSINDDLPSGSCHRRMRSQLACIPIVM